MHTEAGTQAFRQTLTGRLVKAKVKGQRWKLRPLTSRDYLQSQKWHFAGVVCWLKDNGPHRFEHLVTGEWSRRCGHAGGNVSLGECFRVVLFLLPKNPDVKHVNIDHGHGVSLQLCNWLQSYFWVSWISGISHFRLTHTPHVQHYPSRPMPDIHVSPITLKRNKWAFRWLCSLWTEPETDCSFLL